MSSRDNRTRTQPINPGVIRLRSKKYSVYTTNGMRNASGRHVLKLISASAKCSPGCNRNNPANQTARRSPQFSAASRAIGNTHEHTAAACKIESQLSDGCNAYSGSHASCVNITCVVKILSHSMSEYRNRPCSVFQSNNSNEPVSIAGIFQL